MSEIRPGPSGFTQSSPSFVRMTPKPLNLCQQTVGKMRCFAQGTAVSGCLSVARNRTRLKIILYISLSPYIYTRLRCFMS